MCQEDKLNTYGLSDEAIKFFAAYSRFEFALKYCGYLQDCNVAKAAIVGYFNSLEMNFWRQFSKLDLLQDPPKKLECIDPKPENAPFVKWVGPSLQSVSCNANLADVIRDLRNNMFHGSKAFSSLGEGRDRDIKLLNNGLKVIEAAAKENREVKDVFIEY